VLSHGHAAVDPARMTDSALPLASGVEAPLPRRSAACRVRWDRQARGSSMASAALMPWCAAACPRTIDAGPGRAAGGCASRAPPWPDQKQRQFRTALLARHHLCDSWPISGHCLAVNAV